MRLTLSVSVPPVSVIVPPVTLRSPIVSAPNAPIVSVDEPPPNETAAAAVAAPVTCKLEPAADVIVSAGPPLTVS